MTAGSVLATVAVLGWAAADTVGAFYVGVDRHRRRHGPGPLRTGPGRPRQAVRRPRHPGHHHPHPRRRVRQHHLPTPHRDPRRPPRLADVARRARPSPSPRSRSRSTSSCCPADHRRGPAAAVAGIGTQRDGTAPVTLLTVAFTLAMATMAAGIVHLIPYLVDHGWSPVLASIAAGTLGATQVAARVAFGPTARRTSPAQPGRRHPRPSRRRHRRPGPLRRRLDRLDRGRPARRIAQGTATLLRPMLLSRLNGPHGYGRLAATSAATTTIARATAPLVLAAIAAAVGYGVGFTLFALASVVAAVLATAPSHPTLDPVDTEYSLSSS